MFSIRNVDGEPVYNPNPAPIKPSAYTRIYFFWFTFWSILFTLVAGPVLLCHFFFSPKLNTFRFWSRIWAKCILWISGIRVELTSHFVDETSSPVVFVSNHQNSVDILLHCAYLPLPFAFLAKEELRGIPVIGRVLSKACIFVDRSSARKAVESIRAAGMRIKSGHSLLVYGEGQRMWGPEMAPFMRGAFEVAVSAGAPIVPVVIRDGYKSLDERIMVGRPTRISMEIGRSLSTTSLRRGDIPGLMAGLHRAIQDAVNGRSIAEADVTGFTPKETAGDHEKSIIPR